MQFETNRSSLTRLPGWHLKSVWFDTLHALYLGVGLDLLGSALAILCGPVPAGHADLALKRLWRNCRDWCSARHLPCTIEKFSKHQLFRAQLIKDSSRELCQQRVCELGAWLWPTETQGMAPENLPHTEMPQGRERAAHPAVVGAHLSGPGPPAACGPDLLRRPHHRDP